MRNDMTDRDALLWAVCMDPDADLPRLVYADWLEEHGEEDRAEFVRLQIGRGVGEYPHGRSRAATLDREYDLFAAADHGRDWVRRDLGGELFPLVSGLGWPSSPGDLESQFMFARGFLETLFVHREDFVVDAAGLFRRVPARRVRLGEAYPLGGGEDGGWYWLPERGHPPYMSWEVADELYSRDWDDGYWASAEGALDALSSRCLAYGRRAAGLDAAESEETL